MNINDKDFIKNVIQDDLSVISNPCFTSDTLLKIRESRNIRHRHQVDLKLIYPVFIYAMIVILISTLRVFNLLVAHNRISFLEEVVTLTSDILFDPVTVSILISVFILYYLDLYLGRWRSLDKRL